MTHSEGGTRPATGQHAHACLNFLLEPTWSPRIRLETDSITVEQVSNQEANGTQGGSYKGQPCFLNKQVGFCHLPDFWSLCHLNLCFLTPGPKGPRPGFKHHLKAIAVPLFLFSLVLYFRLRQTALLNGWWTWWRLNSGHRRQINISFFFSGNPWQQPNSLS